MLITAILHWLLGHKLLLTAFFIIYQLLWRVDRYRRSPLVAQHIPGPRLAAFTSWYRFLHIYVFRSWQHKLYALHQHYGPVVQVAPNEVNVSDPRLRNTIYSFADERQAETFFAKSKTFETAMFNRDFNFIFEQEPEKARFGKRTLAHPFSERGLAEHEADFEAVIDALLDGMRKHVVSKPDGDGDGDGDKEVVANISHWCIYYMYDLVVQLCTGNLCGYCQKGFDFNGSIGAMRFTFEVVGNLIPINFALRVTSRATRGWLLSGLLDSVYNGTLCHHPHGTTMENRIHTLSDASPGHFISKFRAASTKMRHLFPTGNTQDSVTNSIFFLQAGSTVSANNLPFLLTQVFSRPDVVAKIRAELATLDGGGRRITVADLDRTIIAADGSSECTIPYIEAVVLEAIRLMPNFAMPLVRFVPSAGCQLNQFFVPQKYMVGMSSWSVNRDTSYFGDDATEFVPERWLGNHPTELAKDGSGRPRTMRNYLEAGWLSFGAGARVCVGRHLAVVAATKLLGALAENFEMELVDEGKQWYGLIVHSEDVKFRVTEREEHKQGDGEGGQCGDGVSSLTRGKY